MNLRSDDIANHARFIILSISSHCVKTGEEYDITNILNLLLRNSHGQLKLTAKKLTKLAKSFIMQETWHFAVCWQLSLDEEENLALF